MRRTAMVRAGMAAATAARMTSHGRGPKTPVSLLGLTSIPALAHDQRSRRTTKPKTHPAKDAPSPRPIMTLRKPLNPEALDRSRASGLRGLRRVMIGLGLGASLAGCVLGLVVRRLRWSWARAGIEVRPSSDTGVLGPLPWLVIRAAVAAAIPARTIAVRRIAARAEARNNVAGSAFAGCTSDGFCEIFGLPPSLSPTGRLSLPPRKPAHGGYQWVLTWTR